MCTTNALSYYHFTHPSVTIFPMNLRHNSPLKTLPLSWQLLASHSPTTWSPDICWLERSCLQRSPSAIQIPNQVFKVVMWHTKIAMPTSRPSIDFDPAASLLLSLFATYSTCPYFLFHGLPVSPVPFPTTASAFDAVLKTVGSLNALVCHPQPNRVTRSPQSTSHAETIAFFLPLSSPEAQLLLHNPHLQFWEAVYKGPHPCPIRLKLFLRSKAHTSFYNSTNVHFLFPSNLYAPVKSDSFLSNPLSTDVPLHQTLELIRADPIAFQPDKQYYPTDSYPTPTTSHHSNPPISPPRSSPHILVSCP